MRWMMYRAKITTSGYIALVCGSDTQKTAELHNKEPQLMGKEACLLRGSAGA